MSIIEALLLGAVQGLTEFIPVSSSGHLVLAEHLFAIHTPFIFSSLINLGTFLALLIYFRKRLLEIYLDIVKHKNLRLARNVTLSVIPVGIVGFFFGNFFEQGIIQQPLTVAVMLALLGVVMIVVERLPRLSSITSPDKLTPTRAGLIGFAQAVSLIPGTSRSASSMVAARLVGLDYRQAAEYSFLLSIPVMFGVLLKGLASPEGIAFVQANLLAFVVSNVSAFVTGLLAVGFMLRYLAHGNLSVFGWYRLGLAAVILIILWT